MAALSGVGHGFVAVVGNPRVGSRTAALAVRVRDAVAGSVGAPDDRVVVDLAEVLAEVGPPLGPDSARRYAGPLAALRSARFAVVATPTYKGSYTGLLKAFLDHVAAGELRGVVAVPVMTVGSPAHALAAEVHLRPLLIELGAVTPTAALVVGEDRLADPAAAVAEWLAGAAPVLRALLGPPDDPNEVASGVDGDVSGVDGVRAGVPS